MSTITFNGLGSGLQIDEIVGAVLGAEVAPATARLNRLESSTSEEISALGQLQSSIQQFMDAAEGLDDPDLYISRKAQVDTNDFFSASAKEGAQLGNYDIAVKQLATATKIATVASSVGAEIGEGTLNLLVGTENSLSIDVAEGSNTLADIRDAINDHEGNDFVSAAIIRDDNGERLILTSTQTGSNQEIKLSAQDSDGNDTNRSGLSRLNFDASVANRGQVLQQGQDAELTVDGLSVTRNTNVIDDVIEGLTLTLKAPPNEGETPEAIALAVENDTDKLYSQIDGLVNAYNSLRDFINRQTNVVQVEGSGNLTGALVGDSAVRGLERSMNTILQSTLGEQGGPLGSLIDLGIERNGERGSRDKLLLDEDRVKEALEENFSEIGNLFLGDDGLMGKLNQQIGYFTETGGLLEQRTSGLQDIRKDISVQREALQLRRESIESRLYSQYQAMDRQVAQYSNTISFIQAALTPTRSNNS